MLDYRITKITKKNWDCCENCYSVFVSLDCGKAEKTCQHCKHRDSKHWRSKRL